jgi:hypothetical protein
MGGGLRAARADRLTWLAPPGTEPEAFAAARARLARILAAPEAREIYTAKRRSLYRVEDAELGALAIKEMRNRRPLRSLRFGWLQEHRALGEFRVGAAFAARGGRTPAFVAAALERSALGLRRVLIFLRWLEGARTLTEHLRGLGRDPSPELLDAVAASLVDAARLGLVHGRHSSENLLVTPRPGGVDLWVIDFAYSRLADDLDAEGLVEDAARVAHRLLHERVCSREAMAALFERLARRAWPDPQEASRRRAALAAALDAALRSQSKQARR